jgi:hypothetical protein
MRLTWPTILVAAGITLAVAVPAASAASPADDYAAASLFAFALGGAGLG